MCKFFCFSLIKGMELFVEFRFPQYFNWIKASNSPPLNPGFKPETTVVSS